MEINRQKNGRCGELQVLKHLSSAGEKALGVALPFGNSMCFQPFSGLLRHVCAQPRDFVVECRGRNGGSITFALVACPMLSACFVFSASFRSAFFRLGIDGSR